MACKWLLIEQERVYLYLLNMFPNEKSYYALGQTVLVKPLLPRVASNLLQTHGLFQPNFTVAWDALSVHEVLESRWLRRSEEAARRLPGLQDADLGACQTTECLWQKQIQSCRCSRDLLLRELFLCKEDKTHLSVQTNSTFAHGSK